MKIVCISDTHSKHRQLDLPAGDVLIHAGDFSKRGRPDEIQDFNAWLAELPYAHKLVIAGNHDFLFETDPTYAQSLLPAASYLEDSGTEIEGLKFWGSPVSPRFFDWAFNRSRGEEIAQHWAKIPMDTDILISHGPPQGILDRVWLGGSVGCEDLLAAIGRVKPKLVVFGHIHEGYGMREIDGVLYLNAASLNRIYQPSHPPIVVSYEAGKFEVEGP